MKRHWLRGTLLGLSLALLLAGGAALAQGLSVTVDQDCFECWPRTAGWPPPDDHIVELTVSGYGVGDVSCGRLTINGHVWSEGCWVPAQPAPCTVAMAVECQTMELLYETDCWDLTAQAFGGDVAPSQVVEHGEWVWRQWEEEIEVGVVAGPVYASVTFAEVCEEEFVPEPGTMMLLGSGLAGLAGYAALRWRTRD